MMHLYLDAMSSVSPVLSNDATRRGAGTMRRRCDDDDGIPVKTGQAAEQALPPIYAKLVCTLNGALLHKCVCFSRT